MRSEKEQMTVGKEKSVVEIQFRDIPGEQESASNNAKPKEEKKEVFTKVGVERGRRWRSGRNWHGWRWARFSTADSDKPVSGHTTVSPSRQLPSIVVTLESALLLLCTTGETPELETGKLKPFGKKSLKCCLSFWSGRHAYLTAKRGQL